jgi:glycine oxidase
VSRQVDVVIIGGGMAGCMSAYYLLKAGATVAIIENSGVGTRASGVSAGGLNPLHGTGIPGVMSDLAMQSFDLHMKLWEQLRESGAEEFFPRHVERLFLAFNEERLAKLEVDRQLYASTDFFSAHLLDGAEVRELVGGINSDVVGALYSEGNAAVDSFLYNKVIAKAVCRWGGEIILTNTNNMNIDNKGHRVKGVVTEDGVLSCAYVVLAAGAWGRDASDWLGFNVPIEPLKGEMLLVDIPGLRLGYDITDTDISLFCRGNEHVWIGATETHEGFDDEPSGKARRDLINRGIKILPSISQAKILRQTAGLRPLTSDGLPIVGKAPGWDNVYMNNGAGRKGTLISAGMGRAIADLITRGKTSITIEFAKPNRFIRSAEISAGFHI